MSKKPLSALITLILCSSPCFADRWHGDIRHFRGHDLVIWRGGHWYHGPHYGTPGWWWVANGVWYYYSRPVYPYPNPYVPAPVVVVTQAPPAPVPPQTTYVVQPDPNLAPPQIASAEPPAAVQAPAPAAPPTWYYCNNPRGYYPYVSACPGGWSPVPAVPPK